MEHIKRLGLGLVVLAAIVALFAGLSWLLMSYTTAVAWIIGGVFVLFFAYCIGAMTLGVK